jgi:hypothetical protein
MEYSLSGGKWTESQIGGSMAAFTDPAVEHEAIGNGWWVYYQGSDGALWEWSLAEFTWTDYRIG